MIPAHEENLASGFFNNVVMIPSLAAVYSSLTKKTSQETVY
jgi:hypothetical protein